MKQLNSIAKKTAEKKPSNGNQRLKAHSSNKTSETFWNALRIANNVTLDELSEMTGLKVMRLSAIFTGRYRATDTENRMFCELFGVDLKKGRLEFDNGFTIYHNTQFEKTVENEPRKLTESTKEEIQKMTEKVDKPEFLIISQKAERPETSDIQFNLNIDDLLRIIYDSGDLSFDEYITLASYIKTVDGDVRLIMKWIYRKVQYDTYGKIACLFKV